MEIVFIALKFIYAANVAPCMNFHKQFGRNVFYNSRSNRGTTDILKVLVSSRHYIKGETVRGLQIQGANTQRINF